MNFLSNTLLPLALMAVAPVVSLDVLLEFSGRPANLEASQLVFLSETFASVYNQQQATRENKKKRSFVTNVEIDMTDGLASSLVTQQHEAATQPFTLLAEVSCDGCKRERLFKAKRRHRVLDNFVLFFNNAMSLNSNGTLVGSIESLIAVQQIEEVASCSVQEEEEEPLLSKTLRIDFDGTRTMGDGEGEEDLTDVQRERIAQAFLETFNFLNTASATSRRCDKTFPTVVNASSSTTVVAATTTTNDGAIGDRALFWTTNSGTFTSFRFRITWRCSGCDNLHNVRLTDDGFRRRRLSTSHADELDDIEEVLRTESRRSNSNNDHHPAELVVPRTGRMLASPDKLKCKCPVGSGPSTSLSKAELVLGLRQAIQTLQEAGELPLGVNVLDFEELIE